MSSYDIGIPFSYCHLARGIAQIYLLYFLWLETELSWGEKLGEKGSVKQTTSVQYGRATLYTGAYGGGASGMAELHCIEGHILGASAPRSLKGCQNI